MIWLVLFIVFLAVEFATVGLTTIWLAAGALLAMLFSVIGLDLVWQVAAFFIASFALLVFTRPFAVKYINGKHERTNYESMPGKIVKITEKVDNLAQTGVAVVNGIEWTARAKKDEEVIESGMLAKVVEISGVKLIVESYDKEEEKL